MANGAFAGGNGTTTNPYLIEDGFDLNKIRENLTADYKIISNIDLTEICNEQGVKGWTPIENFRGTLEGNGHTLRNLFINDTENDYRGLFSSLRGGAIMNLGLANANVTGKDYSGALVGIMYTQEDLVENCFITGNVIGTNYIGGIAGSMMGGTVINSFSEATISATSFGAGLVGYMNNSYAMIKDSYAAATVTSPTNPGGIVGSKVAGIITNAFFDNTLNFAVTTSDGLSTANMQKASSFSSWEDQYYSFEKKVWVLKDGSYPKLFYTEATKYFVFVNNEYMTYKNNEWKTAGNTFPTESIFASHGMTDNELADVPRYKWNKLRQYKTFDIVASTDKFTVERKVTRKKMEIDTQFASCVLLKSDIDFSELGDSINRIRVIQ